MTPRVLSTTFLVVFGLILYQLTLIFSPFLAAIGWALILVRLFYPLYDWLRTTLRQRATLAALCATGIVTFVVVLPIIYILFLAVNETLNAYARVAAWVEQGGLNDIPQWLSSLPLAGHLSQDLIGRFIVAFGDFHTSLFKHGEAVSAVVLSGIGGLAESTLGMITDFLIMLFTLFFLFRDGDRLFEGFYAAIPIAASHKARIFKRLDGTLVAVMRGSIATALLEGLLQGLTYWLLGVPFPVFLGALGALLSLLPYGGTVLVWGPVAAYLFWTAPVWKGLVMVVVGVVLIGLMENVIEPLLIGSDAELPVLFLFFSSVGGLTYFGFIGLFLGPILLALAVASFQIYREQYLGGVALGSSSLALKADTPDAERPAAYREAT